MYRKLRSRHVGRLVRGQHDRQRRDLLRSGRYSVSGASFEVGYESPTHFSHDYQRKFGVSPSKDATIEAALF
ncbi:MAG: helix-turn-helix domain-containing protein [Rhodobacteraceae bacterium]|nr:helix-turn-helix domain-containing protein [Paracoccaceae bacterium]